MEDAADRPSSRLTRRRFIRNAFYGTLAAAGLAKGGQIAQEHLRKGDEIDKMRVSELERILQVSLNPEFMRRIRVNGVPLRELAMSKPQTLLDSLQPEDRPLLVSTRSKLYAFNAYKEYILPISVENTDDDGDHIAWQLDTMSILISHNPAGELDTFQIEVYTSKVFANQDEYDNYIAQGGTNFLDNTALQVTARQIFEIPSDIAWEEPSDLPGFLVNNAHYGSEKEEFALQVTQLGPKFNLTVVYPDLAAPEYETDRSSNPSSANE